MTAECWLSSSQWYNHTKVSVTVRSDCQCQMKRSSAITRQFQHKPVMSSTLLSNIQSSSNTDDTATMHDRATEMNSLCTRGKMERNALTASWTHTSVQSSSVGLYTTNLTVKD